MIFHSGCSRNALVNAGTCDVSVPMIPARRGFVAQAGDGGGLWSQERGDKKRDQVQHRVMLPLHATIVPCDTTAASQELLQEGQEIRRQGALMPIAASHGG